MIKKFLIGRLKEASTWRGIILFVSGIIGYNLNTEQQAILVTLAITVVGAIGAFMPDKVAQKTPEVAQEPIQDTKLPESPSE